MQNPTDTPALAQSPRESPWRWLVMATVVLALGMFIARSAAPSDLDGKDQPRTVSYTVDMAVHGRLVLPKDMQGQWSFKPPLYNWMALPVVGGMGVYRDWAFKLPSVLGALVATWLTWIAVVHLLGPSDQPLRQRRVAGGLAMLIWLSMPPVVALAYVARPDMLLATWLIGGWLAATHVLQDKWTRWWGPVLIWLCVAGALLTKGPAALLIPLYIVAAAYPLTGRFWRPIRRTWLPLGLPLSFAPVAWWVWAAHRAAPDFMSATLVGMEAGRISGKGGGVGGYLWNLLVTGWKYPFYFVMRALPWSWVFLGLVMVGPRATKSAIGKLMPAIIWCLVIFVFFNLAVLKRDDYLLPAYPAVAAMIAYGLLALRHFGSQQGRTRLAVLVTVTAAAVIAGVVLNDAFLNPNRKGRWSDEARRFGMTVEQTIGDATVVFERTGYHPLQAYMGRNQAMRSPTPAMWAEAQWVVTPLVLVDDRQPVVTSAVLPNVLKRQRLRLGLYRREADKPWPPVFAEVTGK